MTGLPHIRELCAKLLQEEDANRAEVICSALKAALDEYGTTVKIEAMAPSEPAQG